MTGVKKSENEIRESHDDLGPVMLHNIHQNHPEKNGRDSWVSSGVTVSYSNKKNIHHGLEDEHKLSLSLFHWPTEKRSCSNRFFFFFLARVP